MDIRLFSDAELLDATKNLVKKEQVILSEILLHLEEVERRRLFSDLKYPSLFSYCMGELKYSEQQACRRISAMRLLKKLPEVKKSVDDGSLSISSLNLASSLFKTAKIESREEQTQILNEFKNTTKAECEEKVLKIKETMGIINEPKKDITKKVGAETIRIHVNISEATHEKLQKIKGLLKEEDFDKILNQMADALIDQKTKLQTRSKESLKEKAPTNSRYISKNTKAKIYQRANGKCVQCGSVFNLEYDHQTPFAKGGSNGEENIQLLCKNCNQRKAIKDYGIKKMDLYLNQSAHPLPFPEG